MDVTTRNKTVSLLRNMFEKLMAVYQVYCFEFIETEIRY
jgi:hypothetical protein